MVKVNKDGDICCNTNADVMDVTFSSEQNIAPRFKSSLQKFYGRQYNLVSWYGIFVLKMKTNLFL